MQQETERLQKYLARRGISSRRKCEELIRSGRVTVNGVVASLGQKVISTQDVIHLDGELVGEREPLVYLMLNKPPGVLSSRASQGGYPTVIDMVDVRQRVYPVGRLDLESEGLIILTNDGELAHQMTHPSFMHEKEYRVLLNRQPDQDQIKAWRMGIQLPTGEKTAPADVRLETKVGDRAWIRVTMVQGLKRQIRMTAETLGLRVLRIFRLRMGNLELSGLRRGEWRHLTASEIKDLKGRMNQ